MRRSMFQLLALSLLLPFIFCGCGSDGSAGAPGASAPATGTISGTVTEGNGNPLAGVQVTATDKASGGTVIASTTTDASGQYTLTVPIGGCYVNFSKANFTHPGGMFVGVGGGMNTTLVAVMNASSSGAPSVSFAAEAGDCYGYGATIQVAASASLNVSDPDDPVSSLTYSWSNSTSPKQDNGSLLGTVTGSGTSATIKFPSLQEAFASRTKYVTNGSEISGYRIPDRFGILPVFPDTRGAIGARVTVTDPHGNRTTATITLNAATILPGVRTVPLNTRVYLNSGHASGNSWTGAGPGGAIAYDNASIRTPSFVTSAAGKYTVSEGGNSMDIYAGSYEGVIIGGSGNTFTVDPLCTMCHQGTIAVDKFTPWKQTNHATLFTRNVNILWEQGGDAEGRSCMVCHTVGYDTGAVNGGFDDKMYAYDNNWIVWGGDIDPGPDNWANLFSDPESAAMARMANIQCENCHGPQAPEVSSGAHMSTGPFGNISANTPFTSSRIGFSSEVCAQCHGRTSHNFYSQWATPNAAGGGHSNRQLAIDEGTSTSCGGCHAAQGFTKYVAKMKATGTFTLTSSDLSGLSAANLEPITCTACHDPHATTVLAPYQSWPNPDSDYGYSYKQITNNQLRVYNDSPLLPAGFRVTGFGKGALCVTCHNSRNGARTGSGTATYLHEDIETYNDINADGKGDPTGYSAPHTASQGDVLAGRNAYFMGNITPLLSRHASIENTCVECHMALNPVKKGARDAATGMLTGVSKSHLFRLKFDEDMTKPETLMAKFCSNCHGEDTVNGEAIKAGTEAGLEALQQKIGAAGMAKINAVSGGVIRVRAYDAATDLYSSSSSSNSNVAINVVTNPVTHVELIEGHGQSEFHITLTTPITITWTDGSSTTTNEFGVQLGSLRDNQATPVELYALSGNMVRACWNYFLVEGDDSKGLHNPLFVQGVINATLAKDLSF